MVTDIKHGNLYDVCILCMLFVVPSTAALWQTLLVHYGEHIGSCTVVRPVSKMPVFCLIELLLPSALSLQCSMYQNKKTHGPQRWGWGRRGYKYASCDIT